MGSSTEQSSLSFVRRYNVILKSHYFLFFSAFGVIFPILNIILRSRGLSNTEISLSNLIMPFLVFFSSPLMGFIADKTRRFRLTFNILLSIVIVSFTILFLLPSIQTQKIQADLNNMGESTYGLTFCTSQESVSKCSARSECGCSYQSYCAAADLTVNFTMTNDFQNSFTNGPKSKCGTEYRVQIAPDTLSKKPEFSNSSSIKCEVTCSMPEFCQGQRYESQTVYVFFYAILFIIGIDLFSSGSALGTSIGFSSLPSPDLFGKQRVWGTIGFGIIALLASRIYAYFQSDYVYLIMFDLLAILTIIVTSFIPMRKNLEKKPKFEFSSIRLLLKNIDVIIFLTIAFLWGMCYGCLHPYLGLYIDEITPCQSRSILGYIFFIASISEVFAFYSAKRVINFFGPNLSAIIIFLAFAIRFGGYYFLPEPYLYLLVESMHFFNYGILYVFISTKADLIAPPGLSSTLQGVAHGIIFGIGSGIGLLVSAYIYININQRLLFLIFSIMNIIAAILFSIYFFLTKKKTTNKPVVVSVKTNGTIEEDGHFNQETLPSLPMMTTCDNENKQETN